MAKNKTKAQPRHYKALENWTALNDFLRTAGVEDCKILIDLEVTYGFPVGTLVRETFVKRIWGRYRVAQKIAESRGRR